MPYDLAGYQFDVTEFFTDDCMAAITDVRVSSPEDVYEHAAARKRRATLTRQGKLVILAADHPGRNITKSGDDELVMGNRQEYLGRVLRVVTAGDVDGFMATPDVVEDCLIADMLVQRAGGPSFLDEKVILGSMNRGGLAGTVFEMDDTFTSFSAESIAELNLDGAKLMLRLDPESSESGDTIYYSSQAINDCVDLGLPIFIEPLAVKGREDKHKAVKEAGPLIKMAGVASALGKTSLSSWLKMPYCDGYERVAKATTLPILMLGGESRGDPTPVIAEFAEGMKAGANVRGALCGRNILFPGDDDPRAVAAAVAAVVHESATAAKAVDKLQKVRGKNMDDLAKWL